MLQGFPMPDRTSITEHLQELRETIIAAFESFEPSARFQRKPWKHHSGGGGEIALLRGDIFEKAAVNFSAVSGPHFPMQDAQGPYFATGVSLITHMKNPHAPTVHMNVRYIETEPRWWLGGGYDLTPMGFCYDEDTAHFHEVAKKTLDKHGETLYKEFSENAKQYYYIPHWNKERGVGGIFFDYHNDINMWRDVGATFLNAIIPILDKRVGMPYTEDEKELQLWKRGQYVEFNLIYDRGTKFGVQSGGNPEAYLCSLPPLVKW